MQREHHSAVMVDALTPVEAQILQRQNEREEDYVALVASAVAVGITEAPNGDRVLTVRLRLPPQFLAIDARPILPGIPDWSAGRRLRQMLGMRPLVRLLLRRSGLAGPIAVGRGQHRR